MKAGQNSSRCRMVERLRAAIGEDDRILFAYLHGSFAEGSASYRDIDVALYFRDDVGPQVRLDRALELGALLSYRLGKPVDAQVLNDAPLEFRFAVTRGIVLFSRDEEARLSFVERTWMEYWDFKPLLRESLHDLLQA